MKRPARKPDLPSPDLLCLAATILRTASTVLGDNSSATPEELASEALKQWRACRRVLEEAQDEERTLELHLKHLRARVKSQKFPLNRRGFIGLVLPGYKHAKAEGLYEKYRKENPISDVSPHDSGRTPVMRLQESPDGSLKRVSVSGPKKPEETFDKKRCLQEGPRFLRWLNDYESKHLRLEATAKARKSWNRAEKALQHLSRPSHFPVPLEELLRRLLPKLSSEQQMNLYRNYRQRDLGNSKSKTRKTLDETIAQEQQASAFDEKRYNSRAKRFMRWLLANNHFIEPDV